jgi:hypothetical protein
MFWKIALLVKLFGLLKFSGYLRRKRDSVADDRAVTGTRAPVSVKDPVAFKAPIAHKSPVSPVDEAERSG